MFLTDEGLTFGEKDKEIYNLLKDLDFSDHKFKSILRWTKAMNKLLKI